MASVQYPASSRHESTWIPIASQCASTRRNPIASLTLPGSSRHHRQTAVLRWATIASLASTLTLPSWTFICVRYMPLLLGSPVESTITFASSLKSSRTKRAQASWKASADSGDPTFSRNSLTPWLSRRALGHSRLATLVRHHSSAWQLASREHT